MPAIRRPAIKKKVIKKKVIKKKSRKRQALDVLCGGDFEKPRSKDKDADKTAIKREAERDVTKFMDKDPSKNNKYLLWMATQRLKGHNYEDIYATVDNFHRRQNSLKHQDIYKYYDLKDLEEEILALDPSRSERKYLKNLKLGIDYIPLTENDSYRMYYITSYKGCRNLGDKTRWCIVANSSYWRNYSSSNDIFIIIDSNNESNKYAFLRGYKGYNTGQYQLYDKNDRQIDLRRSFSPALVNEIKDKVNVILAVSGRKGLEEDSSKKNYLLSLDKKTDQKVIEQNKQDRLNNLIETVRNNNLIGLMPFSNNIELMLLLKEDIKKYLGVITFNQNYSTAFFKVFKEDLNAADVLDIIKTTSIKINKLKEFDFVLNDITKKQFRDLFLDTKYKSTKTALSKHFLKWIDIIPTGYVTESMAREILAKEGEDALLKFYPMCKRKKQKYRYSCHYYTTDSAFLSAAKSIKMSNKIIDQLLEKEDLPSVFKNHIKRQKKNKLLTKNEATKVSDLLRIFIKDNSIGETLKVKELEKFIKTSTKN